MYEEDKLSYNLLKTKRRPKVEIHRYIETQTRHQ